MLEALEKRREFLMKWWDRLISEDFSADRRAIGLSQLWETGSRLMVYGDLRLFDANPESMRKPLVDIFAGIDSDDPEKYLRRKILLADEMEKEAKISGMMDESDRRTTFKMAAAIRSECLHAIGLIHGGADFLIPGDDTMIAEILQMPGKDFGELIEWMEKNVADSEAASRREIDSGIKNPRRGEARRGKR